MKKCTLYGDEVHTGDLPETFLSLPQHLTIQLNQNQNMPRTEMPVEPVVVSDDLKYNCYINIKVVKANIFKPRRFFKRSSYVVIEIDGREFVTLVSEDQNLNPVWNCLFQIACVNYPSKMRISLFDQQLFKNVLIGSNHVTILPSLFEGETISRIYELEEESVTTSNVHITMVDKISENRATSVKILQGIFPNENKNVLFQTLKNKNDILELAIEHISSLN
ncbi:hypothetical protein A3Q56_02012 [Intoshia linei]|uniref:C2 domain-containing protein n=1 Tax=Intoshia linei TaxID=1819745 RepID=A0A177B7G9_9BILA|nr:hypothetical protein A3Q56_02012 [Intoshia linei]